MALGLLLQFVHAFLNRGVHRHVHGVFAFLLNVIDKLGIEVGTQQVLKCPLHHVVNLHNRQLRHLRFYL